MVPQPIQQNIIWRHGSANARVVGRGWRRAADECRVSIRHDELALKSDNGKSCIRLKLKTNEFYVLKWKDFICESYLNNTVVLRKNHPGNVPKWEIMGQQDSVLLKGLLTLQPQAAGSLLPKGPEPAI